MRAMLSVFCVTGILATVVSATPLVREKRYAIGFAGSPFGTFAVTGAGFPQFYSTGAAAGFGSPFYPTGNAPADRQYNPASMYDPSSMFSGFPFSPFRIMPMPVYAPAFNFAVKNWYDGDNVCKEEKIMSSQMPDGSIPDEWKKDLPQVSTDYNHEQESCQGTEKKYVCVKRVMGNNGEAQVIATKYECCHGFVRNPSGSGCIESKQQAKASQGASTKLTENDPSYYIYTGNKGRSSSVSSSSAGNIDKVPLQ